jgi:hypothetical protein
LNLELRIETVETIDIRVEHYEWPFARARARDVDAHWRELRAARPNLFNGRVFLFRNLQIKDAGLTGFCFETEFKAFIAARDFGHPDKTVFNCFAQGALRAPDGAFLLGEMAAQTSNPGRIYFPAGTPDPSDAISIAASCASLPRRQGSAAMTSRRSAAGRSCSITRWSRA